MFILTPTPKHFFRTNQPRIKNKFVMKIKIYEYCRVSLAFILISIYTTDNLNYSFPKGTACYEFWYNKQINLSNIEKLKINL